MLLIFRAEDLLAKADIETARAFGARLVSTYGSYCESTQQRGRGEEFCRERRSDPDFARRYAAATAASYTFIMGHELAHHFLEQAAGTAGDGPGGHDRYFDRQGNEEEADEWGLVLVAATGHNSVSSLNGLIAIKLAEPYDFAGDLRHPKAGCRIAEAIKGPIGKKIRDPGFWRRPPNQQAADAAEDFDFQEAVLVRAEQGC